jgi:hypothetical protein
MKLESIVSSLSLKKNMSRLAVIACLLCAPLVGICQALPNGDGGNGGLEDVAVPFDSNMNLMFLIVGIVFAVIITKKYFLKKSVITA